MINCSKMSLNLNKSTNIVCSKKKIITKKKNLINNNEIILKTILKQQI